MYLIKMPFLTLHSVCNILLETVMFFYVCQQHMPQSVLFSLKLSNSLV